MTWTKPDTAEAPPSGNFVNWKELGNALLGFEVLNFIPNLERESSNYGAKDTVFANVTILDGKKAGEKFENAIVDTKVLVRQLKRKVGESVLGRLIRDIDNRGAYTLQDPTDEDIEIANGGGQTSKRAPF